MSYVTEVKKNCVSKQIHYKVPSETGMILIKDTVIHVCSIHPNLSKDELIFIM